MTIKLRRGSDISILDSDERLGCLSWAPAMPSRPYSCHIRALANATVGSDFSVSPNGLDDYCRHRLTEAGLNPDRSVLMLTSVPQDQLRTAEVHCAATGLTAKAYCTVGLGNGLAPGDPALYHEELEHRDPGRTGTINIIVAVNRQLDYSAMVEMVQLVTMAKCQALVKLAKTSRYGRGLILGTGTDCIAVVGLASHPIRLRYAGLGVKLGEIAGMAVSAAVSRAISGQQAYQLARSQGSP